MVDRRHDRAVLSREGAPAVSRCVDLQHAEAASSAAGRMAKASSSSATATRRRAGPSTAKSWWPRRTFWMNACYPSDTEAEWSAGAATATPASGHGRSGRPEAHHRARHPRHHPLCRPQRCVWRASTRGLMPLRGSTGEDAAWPSTPWANAGDRGHRRQRPRPRGRPAAFVAAAPWLQSKNSDAVARSGRRWWLTPARLAAVGTPPRRVRRHQLGAARPSHVEATTGDKRRTFGNHLEAGRHWVRRRTPAARPGASERP
jgi:hypothetical protein